MFTKKDLQILNKIQTRTPTLSFYLNTDQKALTPESIRMNFRNLLKKAESFFDPVSKLKIRRRFRLQLNKKNRGLVFFINPVENIFYEYVLPRKVATALYFEKNLHLTPLAQLLDEYERYLVIVFDKSKARIFSVYLGEIEKEKVLKQYFPGKHDMGGWSQARYQRHIKDHLRRNLKKIKDEIDELEGKKEFKRIILACTPEALSLFQKILSLNLRKKVVGKFRSELFATRGKILAQAAKIEEQIERQKEKGKIAIWQKYLGKGDKSCSGLESVMRATFEKRIFELYLDFDLKKTGCKCYACGNLSLSKKDICSMCGERMEEVADLIDELVQAVLAQNGEVEFVAGDKELKKLGGVGARLRY